MDDLPNWSFGLGGWLIIHTIRVGFLDRYRFPRKSYRLKVLVFWIFSCTLFSLFIHSALLGFKITDPFFIDLGILGTWVYSSYRRKLPTLTLSDNAPSSTGELINLFPGLSPVILKSKFLDVYCCLPGVWLSSSPYRKHEMPLIYTSIGMTGIVTSWPEKNGTTMAVSTSDYNGKFITMIVNSPISDGPVHSLDHSSIEEAIKNHIETVKLALNDQPINTESVLDIRSNETLNFQWCLTKNWKLLNKLLKKNNLPESFDRVSELALTKSLLNESQ